VSGEDKVRQASALLREAFDESECPWCARNLERLSVLAADMAEVMPYTSRTAEEVRKRTEPEIEALGGKIGILKRVVQDNVPSTVGNSTGVEQLLYRLDDNSHSRGLSMDKARVMQIASGTLALGAGLGFIMNQLDNYLSLGPAWYLKLGPIINILGGIALMVLGQKGKIFKSERMQYFAVAGGAAMMSNGILKLVERAMASGGMIPAPSGRPFVNARAPGQLPYRMVEETKTF
jgi:hypothetical protein